MPIKIKEDYELIKSMGLIVRSHNIVRGETYDKKKHIFQDKIYSNAKKKLQIKYESKLDITKNALHIMTGELHGGYIGIDIDNKPGKGKTSYAIFMLTCLDELPYTLVCKTPNDGYHYVFKLNNNQKKHLANFKTKEARLFDQDIDVLYNTGRFVMSGSYENYFSGLGKFRSEYVITQKHPPVILPDIIFKEIIRKCGSGIVKPTKTLNNKNVCQQKITSDMNKKSECEKANIDDVINSYLQCLSADRCDRRDDWLRIGAIIFNEKGSYKLFENWSKKSKKYEKNACKKLWASFSVDHDKKPGMALLRNYVKNDNSKLYNEIVLKSKQNHNILNNIIEKKVKNICDGMIHEKGIAELLYDLYPSKYIYDETFNMWYKLNKYNIYVEQNNSMYSVRNKLRKEILTLITDYSSDQLRKNINELDKESDLYESRVNKYVSIAMKTERSIEKFLCSETKNDLVIRSLENLCRQSNFYEKLDTINPYIFAFNNGVYDLKNNVFRLPKIEEYVSCTCKYDYKEPDNKYVEEIDKIFENMIIDPDERTYFLTLLSTSLVGLNLLEIFIVLIGTGSNGKGLITQFLDVTLGGYFGTLDVDYFNKKDSVKSGAATGNLAACKNARWVNVSEVESEIKLKENRLKQFSGRDKVTARNLYSKQFEYVPKFKLCFQTNEDPTIDGVGYAIKRRLRYITLRTKFVDNPKHPKERKIDRNLKERISDDINYRLAFFQLLLKYYRVLANGKKLATPSTFKKDVNNYLNTNNPVKSFIKDCLIVTENENDKIMSSDLYNEYKIYSNDFQSGNMSCIKFKNCLETYNIKSHHEKTGTVYGCIKYVYRPSTKNTPDDLELD